MQNKPTRFTTEEGGTWVQWENRHEVSRWYAGGRTLAVHSIEFDDGSVFDVVNGWRHDGR